MSDWIYIRKPDHKEFVIVAVEGGEVWLAYWDGSLWQFNDGPPVEDRAMLAWMELPNGPTQKEVAMSSYPLEIK